jgi:sugar lactone lactonase YvrE
MFVFLLVIVSSIFGGNLDGDSLFVVSTFTDKNSFSGSIEGPAVDDYGNIYAVKYDGQNTIGKVTPAGKTSLFVTFTTGSKTNGIRFDSNEDMYVADYGNHRILKVDMDTKAVSVYAHDDRMNQPNDIAITDDNVIYASDPNWGNGSGNLWMIDTTGTTHLLLSNLTTTNGIEVSPDNKTLYVGESKNSRILAFDILDNDSVANKRVFKQFDNNANLDGMRCDSTGNVYVAAYDKNVVYIISPTGVLIRRVEMIGTKATNIAFGGVDGKTCYVTMAGNNNLETFRTDTPGRSWVMRNEVTAIEKTESNIINKFELEQNYPNPFNPSTNIGFAMSVGSQVNLSVYSLSGEKVKEIVNGYFANGSHNVTFNGMGLASGIYIYKLTADNFSLSKKMMLIK